MKLNVKKLTILSLVVAVFFAGIFCCCINAYITNCKNKESNSLINYPLLFNYYDTKKADTRPKSLFCLTIMHKSRNEIT